MKKSIAVYFLLGFLFCSCGSKTECYDCVCTKNTVDTTFETCLEVYYSNESRAQQTRNVELNQKSKYGYSTCKCALK